MKTEVEMERKLFGVPVLQKSKSEFFSATNLVKAGNKWRINNEKNPFVLQEFLRRKETKEFVYELEKKFGIVYSAGKGRNAQVWVHPLLFIDIALAISPKLKIEVYSWLHDHLLAYRNTSGNSYKEMCGALYVKFGDKRKFPDWIKLVALDIQEACEVVDWQKATEEQLKLRDKIQNNIKLLTNVMTSANIDRVVDLGIDEALADRGKKQ